MEDAGVASPRLWLISRVELVYLQFLSVDDVDVILGIQGYFSSEDIDLVLLCNGRVPPSL